MWEGSSLSVQPMMKAAEKLNRKVECNDDKSVVSGHYVQCFLFTNNIRAVQGPSMLNF